MSESRATSPPAPGAPGALSELVPLVVARLFDELVDRPPEERAARLAALDGRLRREIESLLEAHEAAGGFLLDPPPLVRVAETWGRVGERVGAWRLVSELGRGGMGTVWLAERADGAFEQSAALKRIRGGFVSAALAERFLLERRMLARLSHPNVARLLDGGLDDDGSPYLVLEYVRGRSIDRYCDERRLQIPARLELFEQVCAAVRHAHAQLVVHRDLKPENILVDDEGCVKLLDFGVAKLLVEEGGGRSPTVGGVPPFTPGYAAPEQIEGGIATTATDVYALGVVLRELIWGGRSVREEPGLPPSSAAQARSTTPRELRRAWTGDLGAVVARALEREPDRRYSSVEAFSEDLARAARREPVRARPASVARRLRLFVARHRVAMASATAALAALLAGLIAVVWQARIAARERDDARQQAQRARGVERFLVGLFEGADPAEAKGEQITARELLERGAARVDRELVGQPASQVELLDALARVEIALGRYDKGRELAARGLELARSIHGRKHATVARALNLLGSALVYEGRVAEAVPRFRESLALRRELLGEDHEDVGQSLNDLAIALHQQADFAGAEALYRQALDVQRARLGPEDPVVATTLGNLAGVLSDRGEAGAAAAAAEEALGILRRRFGDDHPLVAATLGDLAKAQREGGDLATAERTYREALAIELRLLGAEHPGVSTQRNNLALVLLRKGDFVGAERELRLVLEIDRRSLGTEHPYIAISLDNLGSALLGQGRAEEALERFREAVAMHRKLAGDAHPRVAVSLRRQAEALAALGRAREARQLVEQVLARLRALAEPPAAEMTAAVSLRERLAAAGE